MVESWNLVQLGVLLVKNNETTHDFSEKCTTSPMLLFLKYSSRKMNKYLPLDDVMIWQPLPYSKHFKGFDWLMLIVMSAYVVTPAAHNNGRLARGT